MHASLEMQHRATAILGDVLEELAKIALRQPLSIVIGKGKTKVLLPHARDAIAADGLLCSIAQNGVMPESYARAHRVLTGTDNMDREKEPRLPVMPVLGLNTNFSKLTATAPDGTEFVAELKRGEVVEGEAVECS